MPLREETLRFDEEIERIEAERDELADVVAEADANTQAVAQKAQRGTELDAHLDGLEWAQNAHDDADVPVWEDDVEAITLGGLTGGEYGALEQDLSEAQANSDRGALGAQRVYQVRAGTVDAPYLDASAADTEQLAAVASLPVGFLKWAQDRIDDLSSVGNGDRQSFDDLVSERRTTEAAEQS